MPSRVERNFGVNLNFQVKYTMAASVLVMIILMVLMVMNVNALQGDGRILNYAGMVRGGTQRIVKQELYGSQDDKMIQQMDDLLESLQTGTGKYDVKKLENASYQESLATQIDEWGRLKAEIIKYRSDPSQKDTLYSMSETYFETADQTVSIVQDYVTQLEEKFRTLEVFVFIVAVMIVMGFIAYYGEMIAASNRNKKLNELAYIDELTGVSNKRKCEERLSDPQPISPKTRITCMMFDLNNLKKMNDEHGHEAGDRLIGGFGKALRQEALPHMFVGRFGGDEFIAVAVDTSQKDIDAFLERLRNNCDQRIIVDDLTIKFAAGMAVSTDFPNKTIEQLMTVADQRMYENKKAMKACRSE